MHWEKVYAGPFEKKEAIGLADELKKGADPNKNGIYDARVRKEKNKNSYQVYIKTDV